MSVKEDTAGLTLKKFTVFSGTKKVGPICPTYIRGTLTNLINHQKKSILRPLGGVVLGV